MWLREFLAECRENDSVLCCSDATGLLEAIKRGTVFDLLFLDVYLPDMKDGREMLLSRASAKDIRKAYQDYLFSHMIDRMDR